MSYRDNEEGPEMLACLECGDWFYGRPDKKFCSQGCRNAWNYRERKAYRYFSGNVLAIYLENHRILDNLIKTGTDSIGLDVMKSMGFKDEFITMRTDGPHGHREYRCLDIAYYQSENKIFGIRRVSGKQNKR